jgi:hypothetical protein
MDIIAGKYGLPIQMCIDDTTKFIPMRVSMCGFNHVYVWSSDFFTDTKIERLDKPLCPECRRLFERGASREEAIACRDPDVVYGLPFRFEGRDYPEAEYQLLLRVEKDRTHPRLVLRLDTSQKT